MYHVHEAYDGVMSNLVSPYYMDYRFKRNVHVVNKNFDTDPMFLLAYYEDGPLIISVLYVYGKYRGAGVGNFLIDLVKNNIENFLQVAVLEGSEQLIEFYRRHQFITTGLSYPDHFGTPYVDLFWASRNFTIDRTRHGYSLDYI